MKAVHEKGGIFFCQLWHVGRVSNYSKSSLLLVKPHHSSSCVGLGSWLGYGRPMIIVVGMWAHMALQDITEERVSCMDVNNYTVI